MKKTVKYNKFTLDWGKVGVLVLGFLAGQVLVAILGLFMLFVLHKDFQTSAPFMMVAYVFSMLFPILAFDFLSLKPKGIRFNPSFRSRPFIAYLFAFPMMFGMMLISEYLVGKIPTEGPIFGKLYGQFSGQIDALSGDHVAMIVMTVILAPLLEELLFRGIILKGLLNKGMKPYIAIIISAFIFGAVHFYPWQFLGAFLLGLVLGLVYWKTKSLLLPVLLHGFNNLIASLSVIYFKKEDSLQDILHFREIWLLYIGIVIFVLFFYLFLEKYRILHLEDDYS